MLKEREEPNKLMKPEEAVGQAKREECDERKDPWDSIARRTGRSSRTERTRAIIKIIRKQNRS